MYGGKGWSFQMDAGRSKLLRESHFIKAPKAGDETEAFHLLAQGNEIQIVMGEYIGGILHDDVFTLMHQFNPLLNSGGLELELQ